MIERELTICDECVSLFFKGSSQMMGLCSYSLWLSELSPSFPEWPMCELLLGRLKERAHKETKSTGGNGYAYNGMAE